MRPKHERRVRFALCLAALLFCGARAVARQAAGAPQIFGEGVVSAGFDESGGAFTPGGETFFFVKGIRWSDLSVIVFTRRTNGRWGEPRVAPFSGRYDDKDPFISADGARLYFSSNRPAEGADAKTDFDLWVVERRANGWGRPRHLGGAVNTSADEESPSLAADGTLYFTSNREGGQGGFDVYRARMAGDSYAAPENLGEAVNARGDERQVTVEPRGRFLLFSSRRPGGSGDLDIYVSRDGGGRWLPAQNLGPGINSGLADFAPLLSRDGKTLFFTSHRAKSQAGGQERPSDYPTLVRRFRAAGNNSADIYHVGIGVLTQ
ncbi:MAG TPA: hypothetical protein VF621_03080 [Pyrinomonadaceae bacterium]